MTALQRYDSLTQHAHKLYRAHDYAESARAWQQSADIALRIGDSERYVSSLFSAADTWRSAGAQKTATEMFSAMIESAKGIDPDDDHAVEFYARALHGLSHSLQPGQFGITTRPSQRSAELAAQTVGEQPNSALEILLDIGRQAPSDGPAAVPLLGMGSGAAGVASITGARHAQLIASGSKDLPRRLMAEALDLLRPYRETRPPESGLREQLARAEECYSALLFMSDELASAETYVTSAIEHWANQRDLETGQLSRYAHAVELLGDIRHASGRKELAMASYADAIAIARRPDADPGSLASRLERYAARMNGPLEDKLAYYFEARELTSGFEDPSEMFHVDRAISKLYDTTRPRQALTWHLSSMMLLIVWQNQATPQDASAFDREIESAYARLQYLAAKQRTDMPIVNALLWFQLRHQLQDHVRSWLEDSFDPAQPIPSFEPGHAFGLAPEQRRPEYRLVMADVGRSLWFALRKPDARWDITTVDGRECRRFRDACTRAIDDIRRYARRSSRGRRTQRPDLHETRPTFLLQNELAAATPWLPIALLAQMQRQLDTNSDPLELVLIPCGDFVSRVPWSFVPIETRRPNGHFNRVLLDCAIISYACGVPIERQPTREGSYGVAEGRIAVTTSRALSDLPVRLVQTKNALLAALGDQRTTVAHVAGHTVVRQRASGEEVGVVIGQSGEPFYVGDLHTITGAPLPPSAILSACSTATTSVRTLDRDWGGMAGAFLSAGCDGLIATLFEIPEDEGTHLLERFLLSEHVAHDGHGVPDQRRILRKAQLGCLERLRGGAESPVRDVHWLPYCAVHRADGPASSSTAPS
jgi:hypothetical protein